MSQATIAAAALVTGYLLGRARPLKEARRRAWLAVHFGEGTNAEALWYSLLHPITATPVLVQYVLHVITGSERFAPEPQRPRRPAPVYPSDEPQGQDRPPAPEVSERWRQMQPPAHPTGNNPKE